MIECLGEIGLAKKVIDFGTLPYHLLHLAPHALHVTFPYCLASAIARNNPFHPPNEQIKSIYIGFINNIIINQIYK